MDITGNYIEWLKGYGVVNSYDRHNKYSLLFKKLYNTPFISIVDFDSNRAYEGLSLREEYVTEFQNHYGGYLSIADLDGSGTCKSLSRREEYTTENQHRNDGRFAIDMPCNLLELFIALAIRAESMTFDSRNYLTVYEWFWKLLENLELNNMTDEVFDSRLCDKILFRFIDRKYERSGRGGLFPLRNPKKDQRKIELWYQMSAYIDELF